SKRTTTPPSTPSASTLMCISLINGYCFIYSLSAFNTSPAVCVVPCLLYIFNSVATIPIRGTITD
ncbi:hypothetical protein, partial [Bacillus anthracis]|uniref:hypothetical protein n=1 Tax=Bacillus anthracis TaxID=1392 RepID=UPI002852A22B